MRVRKEQEESKFRATGGKGESEKRELKARFPRDFSVGSEGTPLRDEWAKWNTNIVNGEVARGSTW